MEPADIMKIEMTVEQANRILFGDRYSISLRTEAMDFSSRILANEPTPAQAQAALVLAWNEILERSRLTCRKN